MTPPSFIPRTGFLNWKWQLLFIIVAAIEFFVLSQFCSVYGLGSTILLVFMSMVLGLMFMRWEGYACWNRILYLAQHKQPTIDEMKNGILILLGGILMIFPGIVTSTMGLLLFLPPIRWIVRKLFLRNVYFEVPQGMDSSFFYMHTSNGKTTTYSTNGDSEQYESSEEEDYNSNHTQRYDSDDANIIDVIASEPTSKSTVNQIEDETTTSSDKETDSPKP